MKILKITILSISIILCLFLIKLIFSPRMRLEGTVIGVNYNKIFEFNLNKKKTTILFEDPGFMSFSYIAKMDNRNWVLERNGYGKESGKYILKYDVVLQSYNKICEGAESLFIRDKQRLFYYKNIPIVNDSYWTLHMRDIISDNDVLVSTNVWGVRAVKIDDTKIVFFTSDQELETYDFSTNKHGKLKGLKGYWPVFYYKKINSLICCRDKINHKGLGYTDEFYFVNMDTLKVRIIDLRSHYYDSILEIPNSDYLLFMRMNIFETKDNIWVYDVKKDKSWKYMSNIGYVSGFYEK